MLAYTPALTRFDALGAAGFKTAADLRAGGVDAAKFVLFEEGASVSKRSGVEPIGFPRSVEVVLFALCLVGDTRLADCVGLARIDGKTATTGAAVLAVVFRCVGHDTNLMGH